MSYRFDRDGFVSSAVSADPPYLSYHIHILGKESSKVDQSSDLAASIRSCLATQASKFIVLPSSPRMLPEGVIPQVVFRDLSPGSDVPSSSDARLVREFVSI